MPTGRWLSDPLHGADEVIDDANEYVKQDDLPRNVMIEFGIFL